MIWQIQGVFESTMGVQEGLPRFYIFFSPGVDLSRCKDHVVFQIHRIAGSYLRKVVRNFIPEKGPVDE
ncbi:hypothetical protein TNCV_1436401 [Trichonephila clavipes]|nr:hypothetical protein TNCV_1436401 [Trichonephila clavipes]